MSTRAAWLALSGSMSLVACGEDPTGPEEPGRPLQFTDRASDSGLEFVHQTGAAGQKLLLEINAGCVAVLDHDGDGRRDLFFGQGAPLPGFQGSEIDFRDRLFRNLGEFRFEDVTAESGATEPGYTFHASAPDLDGDGDPDLYLCNYRRNTLLQNDGGRFTDATEAVGLGVEDWSTASAFADFDRDGDLDVFVCNYVVYPLDHPGCGPLSRGPEYRSYCNPSEFPGAPDRVLRNDGGRFTDVSQTAGVIDEDGSGLMALLGDVDDDGWVDVFVANDGRPNQLWRNDGEFRFHDVADRAGVAVAGNGRSEASMGCDFADVDADGDLDLCIANLAMETNTLYVAEGPSLFRDRSELSGLGAPSLRFVGFGCEFFDADLDGDADLMVANGHILDNVELFEPSQTFRQPPQFFEGDGGGRFQEVGAQLGPYFRATWVGRGLATVDLDDDGDDDVIVAHNGERPALLENRLDPKPHWVGIELRQEGANRDALGASVQIETTAGTQREFVRGTSSYSAFQDLRVRFGLGEAAGSVTATVQWPDGTRERFAALEIDRYHLLQSGTGESLR